MTTLEQSLTPSYILLVIKPADSVAHLPLYIALASVCTHKSSGHCCYMYIVYVGRQEWNVLVAILCTLWLYIRLRRIALL